MSDDFEEDEDSGIHVDVAIENGKFKDTLVRLHNIQISDEINDAGENKIDFTFTVLKAPSHLADAILSQEFDDVVGKMFVGIINKAFNQNQVNLKFND